MKIKPKNLLNIIDNQKITLSSLKNKKVVLVTSIADPARIKNIIDNYTENIRHIIFPDHYMFSGKDFVELKEDFLIMTLKDTIKSKKFVGANSWYIDYKVNVSKQLQKEILRLLKIRKHR